nr:allatostatin:ISOTYPE=BLAST-2 [Blattella germanica]
DRLYSFGL